MCANDMTTATNGQISKLQNERGGASYFYFNRRNLFRTDIKFGGLGESDSRLINANDVIPLL